MFFERDRNTYYFSNSIKKLYAFHILLKIMQFLHIKKHMAAL